jgi:hypothetical protein
MAEEPILVKFPVVAAQVKVDAHGESYKKVRVVRAWLDA